jgi:predicted nucleic acid-binding protein
MAIAFLDTNIFLRHLLADHPQQSPAATAYLARIEHGEVQARTADTVIFEAVFTLEKFYRQPKSRIRDALLPLIELSGLILPGKRRYRRAFDLYADRNLPFADAYHAALMESLDISQIVTFDRHFERIPGIERLDP